MKKHGEKQEKQEQPKTTNKWNHLDRQWTHLIQMYTKRGMCACKMAGERKGARERERVRERERERKREREKRKEIER